MATSANAGGRFGGYYHNLNVTVLSQDPTANTSRVSYTYAIERMTSATYGAWTTLNNVTFHAVINGVDHAANTNFDFRVNKTLVMMTGEQTISHNSSGDLVFNFSLSCNQLSGSVQFVAASASGSIAPPALPRKSTFTVTPNPLTKGGTATIDISRASSGYTHTVTWIQGEDSGSIGTGVATSTTWTPDDALIGDDPTAAVTIKVETFNGATSLGFNTMDLVLRQPPQYPEVGVGTPYDIRFRRTELDGSNWLVKEPVPYITANFSDPSSASATCQLTVSDVLYDTPLDGGVVAVDVFDGSQWIDVGLRFALTRIERDRSDLDGTSTYSGVSYLEYVLSKGVTMTESEWKDATPGQIMAFPFQEGISRGWGPRMARGFGTFNTKPGTAWANTTSMTVQTGTPMSQILEGLVTDVLVEYRTSYHDNKAYLDMYNPGFGYDWTVAGADPVINLATAALFKVVDRAPVRKDYSDMLTRVRVSGDESTRTRENASLVNPLFGHLEGTVAATGVTDPGRLDALGDAAIQSQATPTVERTFSYDLSSNQTPASLYPYRTFRPGDWILVPGDNSLERVRVSQVTITRSDEGTKATVVVGDLIPSGLAATARKLTQAGGGAIAGGSLRSPLPLSSAIPSEPTGLVATWDGYWSASGAPRASVEVSWDPVVTSLSGTTIAVDLYEVWTRPELGSPWTLFALTSGTTAVVSNLPINTTRDLQVRARSQDGVYGPYSDLITTVSPEPDETLPAPSDPVLSADALGTVSVTWDGLLDADTPPLWFAYLRAEISDTETGAYSQAGQQLTEAGTTTVPGVGAGTWWFRLVPVDRLGVAGDPSNAVSVVVDPVITDTRQPKAPEGLTLTSEGFWNGPSPEATIHAEWDAVTEGVDNDPITIKQYEVWGKLSTDAVFRSLGVTQGTEVTIAPIGPIGSDWDIRVRAQAVNNELSDFSDTETTTLVAPSLAMDAPTTPVLDSWRGLLLVSWDGNLLGLDGDGEPFAYPAPAYMTNVDIWVSVDGGATFSRRGFMTSGDRVQSISGLGVGSEAIVQLVAVDRVGNETPPSDQETITIVGIDGADLVAGSVQANTIAAGVINVNHLAPGFGDTVNISGNVSITSTQAAVSDVQDQTNTNADNLAELRTRYDFTPTEAIISQPGSPFQVSISNTQMEFRESGVARAYLNAGVFNAPKMASSQLVLQWHAIENDPEGTVIRRL